MSQDRMNELHEELHEACRQLLRYGGVDRKKANAAGERMHAATHAITDYQNSAELADEEEEQEFNDKRFTTKPYQSSYNNEGYYAVDGPGDGLGFNAGYLNPHLNCVGEREAGRAATIANIAYKAGRKSLQTEFQVLMHLDPQR